jgi:hypothetical protein
MQEESSEGLGKRFHSLGSTVVGLRLGRATGGPLWATARPDGILHRKLRNGKNISFACACHAGGTSQLATHLRVLRYCGGTGRP